MRMWHVKVIVIERTVWCLIKITIMSYSFTPTTNTVSFNIDSLINKVNNTAGTEWTTESIRG